jgi:autotransporter-associated beta strand protein
VQLNANAPAGAAGTLGNATSAVTVNDGNTGANNTALLIGTSGVTVARDVTVANAGTGTTTLGGNIASGTGDFTGNITLNKATNLEADGTATITFRTGAVGGAGNITKVGTGTVTLSGANTYTGSTTVSAGTLLANGSSSLGASAGNVSVSSGGTLALAGGAAITAGSPTNTVTISKTGTLDLNGSGAAGATGALQAAGSTGQTSQWLGNTTLSGNATISAADNLLILGNGTTYANTINLSGNTLTFNTTSATGVTPVYLTAPTYTLDATNILVNAQISGTGGIVKTGAGTVSLFSFPSNTYTGSTVVTGGKLIVDGAGNAPVISSTSVTVGNAVSPGAANSVVLQMGQSASQPAVNNLIGSYNSGTNVATTAMTVYADGEFNLNGGSNALSSLTLQGGHVNGGNPAYNSLLTITGGVTTLASSQTALINNGYLGISANSFTFNVAKGTAGTDLQIDSIVQNGVGFTNANTSVSLAKTGAGTLTLTAANTYQGVTDIQAGILNIQNGSALGQLSPSAGNLNNGAVVETGAQLQLQNNITVGNKTLTLNGTGIANDGALLNVASSNTYNGFILLGSASRINANAGTTLVIANTAGTGASIINGSTAGQSLTVGGAGNTAINSGIGTNVGSLTKDGTGTLTLAGSNAYTGATAVTAGAVVVTNNNGLAGSGATVSSGAALQFAQDAGGNNVSVVGVAATVNGTGLGNGGAIENLNGSNSYAGNITLGSNARITADTGSTLALNGNVTGAGFALSAGGAGNTSYNGVISGTGTTFTKTDGGTVTLGGTSANTYTGVTAVNAGTLVLNKTPGQNALGTGAVTIGTGTGTTATVLLSQSNQIAGTAAVTLNSDGVLNVNGQTQTVGSIAGSGKISLGTGQLTAGGDNTSTTFSGTLSSGATGSLTKTGTGSLTISSNVNASPGDFAGTLNLSAGSIIASATNTFGGTVNISAGTTLKLSGSTLNIANLNFIGSGTINLDFGSTAAILNVANLNIASGVTLNIVNWINAADYFYATNWNGATFDVRGNTPTTQVVFDSPTWNGSNTIWQGYDHQVTPVPEPSLYGALLLGATVTVLGYRHFRKAAPVSTTGEPLAAPGADTGLAKRLTPVAPELSAGESRIRG